MDFSDALKLIKTNHRVRRYGWNGKGMWLALSPGKTLDGGTLWSPAAAAELAGRPTSVLPYIIMFTAQGTIVPWLCSQTDMLAEDWEIAT